MPLTTAHPAASIPLAPLLGRFGVLAALVIGSGAPDVVYFVPLGFTREQTHSPAALLWYALPVGLVCYAVWQQLLRPAVVQLLLPEAIARRFPSVRVRPANAAIVVSLLVGAATHLVWDAFTHRTGPMVEVVGGLQATLLEVRGRPVPVYKALQYGSSVLGTLVVAWWAWLWIRRSGTAGSPTVVVASTRARVAVWAALLIVPAAAGLARGLWAVDELSSLDQLSSFDRLRAFANHVIRVGGRVFAALVLVIAVGWRLRSPRA